MGASVMAPYESHAQSNRQGTLKAGYMTAENQRQIPLQTRNRGQSDQPKLRGMLGADILASSLGKIKSIVIGPEGEFYVLDGRSGRISVLTDRNRDGRVDIARKLPFQFDRPSAITIVETTLFVSDAQAVWKIENEQKTIVASLQNAGAQTEHRPLIQSPQGGKLILALSFDDETSKIISIDQHSGQASLVASGDGQVTAMAQVPGSALWLGIENQLVPVDGDSYARAMAKPLAEAVTIDQIYLPLSAQMRAKGMGGLAGKFLITQGQQFQSKSKKQGRNIVAINSAFGLPDGDPSVIVDGFLINFGRSSWGRPGPMVWDERGLFFADSQNGVVWKVFRMEAKITINDRPKPKLKKQYKDDVVEKPQAQWGSSISQASSITTGSLLGKNWEDNKLVPKETLMEKLRREEADKSKKPDKSEKDKSEKD